MALLVECVKCDGCGKVADSEDEEPWTYWLGLPLQSSLAVLTGLVKPKTCPRCFGKGSHVQADVTRIRG